MVPRSLYIPIPDEVQDEDEGAEIETETNDNATLRREWRSLSTAEKLDYVEAVQCLYKKPSPMRPNTTIYEDFAWTHNRHANETHQTAALLPWHRYYISIYEKALQHYCGYKGTLVYWNWALDWEEPANSPIFDPDTGLGGDGIAGGAVTPSFGHCLHDGPFAHFRALYVNSRYAPHCLARGFGDANQQGRFSGSPYRPQAMKEILAAETYEAFLERLLSAHRAVHNGVGGDFQSNTAPYDPLFFLHHTQVDRLWWIWQHKKADSRLTDYSGNVDISSNESASLDDPLRMDPMAATVMVSTVMSTETDLLCYSY
ncbi:Di-copper centre-containing protein [Rhizodiscina lignyota]|uniref:Di-copper centre-containing protein n=1 Tax=Rhizodiscina lignyota TaxID=1504668 RepID=A0A9P4I595_9PEZI|nr:Di-copper centre-containing protein [Rhizodiscina lignyota]